MIASHIVMDSIRFATSDTQLNHIIPFLLHCVSVVGLDGRAYNERTEIGFVLQPSSHTGRNCDKLFSPSEHAFIIGERFMCSRGVPVSNLPNRFQQSAAAGEIDPCTWLAFRGGSVQPESVMLVM